MSTESLFQKYAEAQGWPDDECVLILLRYIDNQDSRAAFRDYLQETADTENETRELADIEYASQNLLDKSKWTGPDSATPSDSQLPTDLMVNVYDFTKDGLYESWTLRCTCPLSECFPGDDEGRAIATKNLREHGDFFMGGGASPFVLLTPAHEYDLPQSIKEKKEP